MDSVTFTGKNNGEFITAGIQPNRYWKKNETLPGGSIGSAVGSGTPGSVLFIGAGGVLAQDNANLFWDDTNNRLGIGTATPNHKLVVGTDVGAITGANALLVGDASAPGIYVAKASNDYGRIGFNTNGMSFVVNELGTLANPAMTVRGSGNVGIGTTGPNYKLDVRGTVFATGPLTIGDGTGSAAINLNGLVSSSPSLGWLQNNVQRWLFYTTNAESGSDSGSDLVFGRAYTDAGVGIDNPITITRVAGGSIIIVRPISSTAAITTSATVTGGALKATGLTSGRVVTTTTGGQLTDSSALTYSGSKLEITRASTYSSESTAAISILGASGDSNLLIGADNTNDITYIQSMQNGTSYGTRPLTLQPNGGVVSIGSISSNAKLYVASTAEQFRIAYDALNYTSFSVGSGSALTITPSISGANIVANVGGTGTIQSGGNSATGGSILLKARYDAYPAQTVFTEYSSGGIGLGQYMYQDNTSAWKSSYNYGAIGRGALVVSVDFLKFITATSQNVSPGTDLTSQPTTKFSVDGSGNTTVAGNLAVTGVITGSSTASITTSITSPIHYGGSGASSTLTLAGTASGAPSNAHIILNGSGQGMVAIGTTGPSARLEVYGNPSGSTNFRATGSAARLIVDYNTLGYNYYDAANHFFRDFAGNTWMTLVGSNVGIGTTSPDRLFHPEVSDAGTNAVVYAARFTHITSGTATTGFGVGHEFELENASGTNRVVATQEISYSDATNATEDATYKLRLIKAGTLADAITINSDGRIFTPNDVGGIEFGGGAGNSTTLKTGSDGTFLFDTGSTQSVKFKGNTGGSTNFGYTDGSFNYVWRSDSSGNTTQSGNLTLPEAGNIILGTTTGTKIGTATTQKLGFFNATPIVRPSAYTPTNVTTDRSFDANATSIDELADTLGTLIADLQSLGLIG